MAIDLSSAYSSLHNISSSLTNTMNSVQKSNYNLQGDENQVGESSFEMAFLAMINRSQDAYKVIEQKAAEGGINTDAAETANSACKELITILENYDSMRSANVIPNSITESLLETLNGNSSQDMNPKSIKESMLETLNGGTPADSGSSSDLLSDPSLEQLIYNTIRNL